MLSLKRTPMHARCQCTARMAPALVASAISQSAQLRQQQAVVPSRRQGLRSSVSGASWISSPAFRRQELLSEKENAAKYAGVLETPYLWYFDLKHWSNVNTASTDGKQLMYTKEVKVIPAQKPLPAISVRTLPLQQLSNSYTSTSSDGPLVMGIEICLAGYRYAALDDQKSFTIKKGSIMRLEDIKQTFDSRPVKFLLESDVMGSLSFNHRVQCVWKIPLEHFTEGNALLPQQLLPSDIRSRHRSSYNSGYSSKQEEPQWRVSFELMYALGATE